jgi:ribulose-5-phosphate 4-epimerase/fuculose-1-phosphate aldolase
MTTVEQNYILLCKLFGACLDLVQGTGGNISAKDGNQIYIKKSGFALSDTKLKEGYVICNIQKLHQKFQDRSEAITDTVVWGEGRPSMETFFHLLPYQYIVHLHPTFLLNHLCQETLSLLQNVFPDSLCIPYVQPGIELGEVIHTAYANQKVIFLQNHGVIFLENDMDNLISLISSVFIKFQTISSPHRKTDVQFIYSYYKQNPNGYMKPSFIIPPEYSTCKIKSYTPDFHLFLKDQQSIQLHNKIFYVFGDSKGFVENSEQMHASFFLCHFRPSCKEIPTEATIVLQNNPLEQDRLHRFKAIN